MSSIEWYFFGGLVLSFICDDGGSHDERKNARIHFPFPAGIAIGCVR
jgi:hypothetical protein